jgi:hypothetical protein
MNNPSSLSIEEKVRLATRTRTALPAPRPEFAEALWQQIAAHPQPQPPPSRRITPLLTRPVWAAVIVLLVVLLGIAVIGPQKVVAAFRSLFGYVPDIGFVQDPNTIRMVDLPVRVERDGVVVSVENGLADAQGLHLSLTLEGLPAEQSFFAPSFIKKERPYLILPSGRHLQLLQGLTSRGRAQYVFDVIPIDIDQVVLVLPGLQNDPTANDWQIPIWLRASNPQDRITTVLPLKITSDPHNGVTLVLEEVAQDLDYTILKIRLDTGNPAISPNNEWWTQLTLTDQEGKIYPLTDTPVADPDNLITVRILKTAALKGTEHLSLALHSLDLAISSPNGETRMVSVDGPWQVNWQPLPIPPEVLARFTATPLPTPIPLTPTPTVVIRQSVAEKVLALLQKSFSGLYGQPGWIHMVSENIEPDNSGFLGPKHTIGEYWQYIDEDGKITKYALVVKDPNGAVWQTIARVGAKQVNFTAQTAMEDKTLIEQTRREDLPEAIENTAQQGGHVRMEEVELDGKPCWLITLIDAYNPPIHYAGTDRVVTSTERKTWIERETGDILLRERSDHLADGRSIVLQHLRTLTQERVATPPQEILYYLNQVEKP